MLQSGSKYNTMEMIQEFKDIFNEVGYIPYGIRAFAIPSGCSDRPGDFNWVGISELILSKVSELTDFILQYYVSSEAPLECEGLTSLWILSINRWLNAKVKAASSRSTPKALRSLL